MTRQRCPDEPTDHAVARGRDVSLRNEGAHSPDNHSGVGVTDRSGNDLSDQSSTVSRTRCCKLHNRRSPSTYREPTITKGAMLSSGVGGAGEEGVTYHQVSLRRIRARATAKKPVETSQW